MPSDPKGMVDLCPRCALLESQRRVLRASRKRYKRDCALLAERLAERDKENAALLAERDALRDRCIQWARRADSNERRAEAAERDRDALRRDAERYRWLRDRHDDDTQESFWHVRDHNAHPVKRGGLDDAIDAALHGQDPNNG